MMNGLPHYNGTPPQKVIDKVRQGRVVMRWADTAPCPYVQITSDTLYHGMTMTLTLTLNSGPQQPGVRTRAREGPKDKGTQRVDLDLGCRNLSSVRVRGTVKYLMPRYSMYPYLVLSPQGAHRLSACDGHPRNLQLVGLPYTTWSQLITIAVPSSVGPSPRSRAGQSPSCQPNVLPASLPRPVERPAEMGPDRPLTPTVDIHLANRVVVLCT